MKDADDHIRDPVNPLVCLCGQVFSALPNWDEWQEHKYGPK